MSSIYTPPPKSVVRRSLIEPVDEFPHGFKIFLVLISIPLLFYFLIALTFPTSEQNIFSSLYPKPKSSAAGLVAFPGAEGHGRNTVGGRGGRVLIVTSLADSGPGTLREALLTSGPRIVVFRTGGMISLTTPISIKQPFLTVAGQTAPGDGIAIKGAPIEIATHDVIIRGLRMRIGDERTGSDPGSRDAIRLYSSGDPVFNVILDHNSMSWSIDELNSTWKTVRDVTFQWNIYTEPLLTSIHPEGRHSMGTLVGDGTKRITIHHNLYAHNNQRNPLVASAVDAEVINNVIYNWGDIGTQLTGQGKPITKLNLIGNYYKIGVDTKKGGTQNIYKSIDLREGQAGSQVFLSGNVLPYESDDQWQWVLHDGDVRVDSPTAAQSNVSTSSAQQALQDVLAYAGAIVPKRDSVDVRAIDTTRTGTGRIINSQQEVGGWPSYNPGLAQPDADNDGMPNTWETQKGLNPQSSLDASIIAPSGYTWIEEYINGLIPIKSGTPTLPPLPTVTPIPLTSITPSPTRTLTPTVTSTITPTRTPTIAPTGTPNTVITNLVVNDVDNRLAWSIQSNFRVGVEMYEDRAYKTVSVPAALQGGEWLQIPLDSRTFTGSELARFTVLASADVYVLLDGQIEDTPSWLSGWATEGDNVMNDTVPPTTYRVYKKSFGSGLTVSLGAATQRDALMYGVVVKLITTTLSADINQDGSVDVFDLGILASRYGMTVNDASDAVTKRADLNADRVIDIFDLGMLIGQYRESVQ